MPRRDHDDATLRFGDDDEIDDLGYGRTYSDDDEDEEGWTAPKEGSDLWDEPEDAALEDEEEGLAERDIADDEEGGDDDVADLFADDAPRRGRKRGAPMYPLHQRQYPRSRAPRRVRRPRNVLLRQSQRDATG